MKSSQEKAEELVEKFKFETKRSEIINDILLGDISVMFKHYKAKQCAIIAVEEILEQFEDKCTDSRYYYFVDVKIELEKL
jgi:hypothetical protein